MATKNRRATFYALSVDYNIVVSSYGLDNHCLHIKMFPFSFAPVNVLTFVRSFPLPFQNVTTALYHNLSLVGSGIPVTSVYKLIPHKEIGAWRRRGLVYQPVTGRR